MHRVLRAGQDLGRFRTQATLAWLKCGGRCAAHFGGAIPVVVHPFDDQNRRHELLECVSVSRFALFIVHENLQYQQ